MPKKRKQCAVVRFIGGPMDGTELVKGVENFYPLRTDRTYATQENSKHKYVVDREEGNVLYLKYVGIQE